MKLIAKNISQSYQGLPIIHNVDLEVAQGEIVTILGPSGVGKTTLFQILSGNSNPDSGEVWLDDTIITGQAGHVSYMLQKDLLFEHKKVLENVALPLIIKGQAKKMAYEKALSHFERFGLVGTQDYYPSQLSGGMRQRAALLRTYLFSKNSVLLDEPFSSIDAITKRDLHLWYQEISSSLNLATLLITHDIEEALRLSDRIYIMTGKPGTITEHLDLQKKVFHGESFETSSEFLAWKTKILHLLSP